MAAQSTMMFSKLLTATDIKKRLAIPAKILPSLPAFNGSHAIKIHLMYGTRMWPIICTVRKKGYKKPVFSGGLWRDFVIGNKLNVGDRISMYKVQDSHYRVDVEKEKPAASNQHGALPSPALSFNHGVNQIQTPVTRRRELCNQRKQAPDAPIKQEGAIMELANAATHTFVDHVIAKPSIRIFGANMTDEKAHFNIEKKPFGITNATKGGAMGYGTSDATGEACCKIITDQKLSLDLVLPQPTPYAAGSEVRFEFGAASTMARTGHLNFWEKVSGNWIVGGDFNDVRRSSERKDCNVDSAGVRNFSNCMDPKPRYGPTSSVTLSCNASFPHRQ
ncbi:hypothetical protein V6N13_101545 [Hibiscus sabdariffa]